MSRHISNAKERGSVSETERVSWHWLSGKLLGTRLEFVGTKRLALSNILARNQITGLPRLAIFSIEKFTCWLFQVPLHSALSTVSGVVYSPLEVSFTIAVPCLKERKKKTDSRGR